MLLEVFFKLFSHLFTIYLKIGNLHLLQKSRSKYTLLLPFIIYYSSTNKKQNSTHKKKLFPKKEELFRIL